MQPLEFFKLLADETRLHSVLLIAQEGELCVCELTTALNETQPKISRHLAMLRKSQVLLDRRQGQWVFYRINPALPDWAKQNITHTLEQNTALVQPLMSSLCSMGDRPERAAACCP
ncbi:metalloregulator ArsR/SmtB family transcription factor [Rheinheimera soli]|uniref:metalloregulator ArsR/SmtB family transcription factor n=1 Tax=Rheinheimera soli TaxID=443616 RepID=UPI001E584830|nr:metalloregulator ArsR/SmtB family transcription factor [Rheinheimera soli]